MTVNVEVLLVEELNAHTPLTSEGFEASTQVPAGRAGGDRLITVERVGGPRRDVRDLPLVSVLVWAESRWVASEYATVAADLIASLALTHPQVAKVEISSVYNNPDPDSEHPRFQINAQLTTKQ